MDLCLCTLRASKVILAGAQSVPLLMASLALLANQIVEVRVIIMGKRCRACQSMLRTLAIVRTSARPPMDVLGGHSELGSLVMTGHATFEAHGKVRPTIASSVGLHPPVAEVQHRRRAIQHCPVKMGSLVSGFPTDVQSGVRHAMVHLEARSRTPKTPSGSANSTLATTRQSARLFATPSFAL